MNFQLLGAIYTPIMNEIFLKENSMHECWDKIGVYLRSHLCLLKIANSQQENIQHYICSTINGTIFSSGLINWSEVYKLLNKQLFEFTPYVYLDAYECASWGYALRYHLKNNMTNKILISIVDINVFDFTFWKNSIHWGKSGFGITTLLIEIKYDAKINLMTNGAFGQNPLFEFAIAIKNFTSDKNDQQIALPFFPQQTSEVLRRLLPGKKLLTDYHIKWGHCFGSDPWIALIESSYAKQYLFNNIILTSFALNGYYSLMNAVVNENAILKIGEPQ